jgi:hypothetical protein
MIFGIGILLRVLVGPGGRVLERLGVLPHRWYLREALSALSEDDLPKVIHRLRRGRGKGSARWELIRQQTVYRCRMLSVNHAQKLERLQKVKKAGGIRNTPENDLDEVMGLHQEAIQLLAGYEADLQSLNPDDANCLINEKNWPQTNAD